MIDDFILHNFLLSALDNSEINYRQINFEESLCLTPNTGIYPIF